MCVHLDGTEDLEAVAVHFEARRTMEEASCPSPVRPTDRAPALIATADGRRLGWMRWGWMIPPRVGEKRPKLQHHARSETAATLPLWRESFASRRCLVITAGWWELTDPPRGEPRLPYYFAPTEPRVLALAALWRKEEDGPKFSLLTTEPLAEFAAIKDRMPVILSADQVARWLDPQTPVADLCGMGAVPGMALRAWRVAKLDECAPA